MKIEKEAEFVPEGMLDDEMAALKEGADDDAANAADATATGDAVVDAAEAAETGTDAKVTDDAAAAKTGDDATGKDGVVDAAAADAAAVGEADAGKKTGDAVVETAEEEPETPRPAMPKFEAPADAEAQLAAIATERDALGDQFDNGEINAKTLFAEQAKLAKKERDIEHAIERANFAAEMQTQTWFQNTVPGFLEKNAHYRDNDTLHRMLDAEVRRRQDEAIEKGLDQFDPKILSASDKAIRASLASMGVTPPKKDEAADTAAAAAEAAEAGAADAGGKTPLKVAAKPVIPPSLRQLPAADITGTDSKWAGLDRLADADPIAFEDAMGKLPEADRDAYLARH